MIANDYARRGFTMTEYLLTESRVVVHYLSLLAFPHPGRLQLDYDFPLSRSGLSPPATLAALALALALAVRSRRRSPLLSFSVLWFFFNLAIESTFIPLDLVYEHRLYVPSMSLVALFVALVVRRLSSSGGALVLVLVAAISGYWTFERNRAWADPVRIFEQDAARAPGKARVHANLAKAYLARGDAERARAAFERALELEPGMNGAWVSLANIELDFGGSLDRAEEILAAVIEREPGYPPRN
jgi:tetratricopeptide (TPR) repeat protein